MYGQVRFEELRTCLICGCELDEFEDSLCEGCEEDMLDDEEDYRRHPIRDYEEDEY